MELWAPTYNWVGAHLVDFLLKGSHRTWIFQTMEKFFVVNFFCEPGIDAVNLHVDAVFLNPVKFFKVGKTIPQQTFFLDMD